MTRAAEAKALRLRQIEAKGQPLAEPVGTPLRFVADVMAGRLAKWLRIAGYDVLYSNRFSDDELVEISSREGRILLSRDTRLLLRKSVLRFVYLESQDFQEQVRQVLQYCRGSAPLRFLTRCLRCNQRLAEARPDALRGKVPEYLLRTKAEFKSCPRCGRVFWAGSHSRRSLAILSRLRGRR